MEDRIEVFVDKNNIDNVWGIVSYYEMKNHIAVARKDLIHFGNNQSMNNYIHSYFNSDNVVYHYIDYSFLEYHFYNGNPKRNHIEIIYYEYDKKGVRREKRMKLPPELENKFTDILKKSKNIPIYDELDSRFHRDVDVVEERKERNRDIVKSIRLSLNNFFALAGDKIREIGSNRKTLVKGISILTAFSLLAAGIGKGYKLVHTNNENAKFLVQNNIISDIDDLNIFTKKGEIGQIIEKLAKRQYAEVDVQDIKDVVRFLKNVEYANYDYNESHNTIDYDAIELNASDYAGLCNILEKIEDLYNHCFTGDDNVLSKQGVKNYFNYILSLTFMNDTYHDTRGSRVKFTSQARSSIYARFEEIEAFDNLPPVIRFMVINQAEIMLRKVTYVVGEKAAYYFLDTDKYTLLVQLDKVENACIRELTDLVSEEKDDNKTINN